MPKRPSPLWGSQLLHRATPASGRLDIRRLQPKNAGSLYLSSFNLAGLLDAGDEVLEILVVHFRFSFTSFRMALDEEHKTLYANGLRKGEAAVSDSPSTA